MVHYFSVLRVQESCSTSALAHMQVLENGRLITTLESNVAQQVQQAPRVYAQPSAVPARPVPEPEPDHFDLRARSVPDLAVCARGPVDGGRGTCSTSPDWGSLDISSLNSLLISLNLLLLLLLLLLLRRRSASRRTKSAPRPPIGCTKYAVNSSSLK